jgi:hypothetical protein
LSPASCCTCFPGVSTDPFALALIALHVEVFHRDHLVLAHDGGGGLVLPVPAHVGDAFGHTPDLAVGLAQVVGDRQAHALGRRRLGVTTHRPFVRTSSAQTRRRRISGSPSKRMPLRRNGERIRKSARCRRDGASGGIPGWERPRRSLCC